MDNWELSIDQQDEFDKLCQTIYGSDSVELDPGVFQDAMDFYQLGLNSEEE